MFISFLLSLKLERKIKEILDSADCAITGSKFNKRFGKLGIDISRVSLINNGFKQIFSIQRIKELKENGFK